MNLPWRKPGLILKRARAIRAVRNSKNRWPWDPHTNSTYEFKILDLLRDIRTLLLCIVILLAMVQCSL